MHAHRHRLARVPITPVRREHEGKTDVGVRAGEGPDEVKDDNDQQGGHQHHADLLDGLHTLDHRQAGQQHGHTMGQHGP